jgi:RNA polymerase sigma-70 factor (ECF subfamily)
VSAVSAIRSNARVPAHADVKDAAGGIGRNDLPPAQGRPPAIVIEMRPPAARAPKFEDAVLPHLDAAYNLARWLVRDPAEAEDIVQDACLRALRFFTSFHGDSGKSWLLRIIRNTAYTRLRTNGKRGELAAGLTGDRNDDDALLIEIADPHPGPDAILERTQEAAQLTAAIALLPVDLRESLVLRELEELSYCEIARVTEVPIGTVMSRLHRARRQLSAMWMDDAAELTE